MTMFDMAILYMVFNILVSCVCYCALRVMGNSILRPQTPVHLLLVGLGYQTLPKMVEGAAIIKRKQQSHVLNPSRHNNLLFRTPNQLMKK